ncbi:MAG: carbohydrate-binding domain-containing protein [Clostridia bacterium]|nr:carbohydrate-binding domain-containing protein [Clostridia bacterium]
MKRMIRFLAMCICACMLLAIAPAAFAAEGSYTDAHTIKLSSTQNTDGSYTHSAMIDGSAIKEFDYTWHADPGIAHDEVKNAPAEYYTGTKPEGDVYIAHDIYYFPKLDTSGFKRQSYDGEQEWCYYYTCAEYAKYIFATLPVEGNSVPEDMMHTPEEAYNNAVLHITKAGIYILEGTWHGQIWIDLGDSDDVFADESKKVTLVLNGVDVTCTVAPALVFYSVYECDNTWEDREAYSKSVDLTDAGARVIIADGTTNNFSGENVYRMLRTKLKDENDTSAIPVQKKQRKTDGAFYSYMSMTINGESKGTGVLNITSGYEGLDTELHLGINGGNINIFSDNDGINVNEDGVSVAQINGGEVHILAGLGAEGDGIDSNGYLVINGGTVISMANPRADSGMDSDFGSYINGGTVASFGSTMDWAKADDDSDSAQATMNLRFSSSQSADEAVIITDKDGNMVFAYDPDKDEVAGTKIRSYQGAVISCPALQIGGSYNVYVGGNVTGTERNGVYDIATVSAFSDSAQQCYSGNAVGGMGGGFGGGGFGDFFGGGNRGDRNQQGTMPDGTTLPQMPDGTFDPNQRPQMPDGTTIPDMNGNTRPNQQGGQNAFASCLSPTSFEMTEKVNAFSGVSDSGDHILAKSGEHYICSVCGKTFSDEEGTNEVLSPDGALTPNDSSDKLTTAEKVLSYSLPVVIAAAAITFILGIGAGVAITLIIKKK